MVTQQPAVWCVIVPEAAEPFLGPDAVVDHVAQHFHGLLPLRLLSALLLLFLLHVHLALPAVPPPSLQHLLMDAASVRLGDADPVALHPADAVQVSAVGVADVALGVLVKSAALFVAVAGDNETFVFIHATLGHFGLGERSNDAVVELFVGAVCVVSSAACGQPGMSGHRQESAVGHERSQDLFVPGENPQAAETHSQDMAFDSTSHEPQQDNS